MGVINSKIASFDRSKKMKILITLALISITGAFAQDFGNCKACEFGVKIFFGHLRSQRGVNFQIATLSRDVCPQMEDWFLCDYEVGRHWAGINHVVYDDRIAPYICSSLSGQNCTAMEENTREWDCDSCMRDVVLMAPAFRSLDAAYTVHAQDICHNWYDGVCPKP